MPDPSNFVIPAGVVWTVVGMIALASLGWAFRHERRIGAMLTREDHDQICQQRQVEVQNSLTKIISKLDEQDRNALEHREKVETRLNKLSTDVAVVKTRIDEAATRETKRRR